MATAGKTPPIGAASRVLLGIAIVVVAGLWFVFLFGNPFAAATDSGVADSAPVVIEVVDEGPETEPLSNEELQQLLDEAGASHDGEALVHSSPGS